MKSLIMKIVGSTSAVVKYIFQWFPETTRYAIYRTLPTSSSSIDTTTEVPRYLGTGGTYHVLNKGKNSKLYYHLHRTHMSIRVVMLFK